MAVFLSKAAIIGVVGAVFGYIGGVSVGATWGGVTPGADEFLNMFNPLLFIASIFIAAALCVVAGWVPALKAAHSDPADVLRED